MRPLLNKLARYIVPYLAPKCKDSEYHSLAKYVVAGVEIPSKSIDKYVKRIRRLRLIQSLFHRAPTMSSLKQIECYKALQDIPLLLTSPTRKINEVSLNIQMMMANNFLNGNPWMDMELLEPRVRYILISWNHLCRYNNIAISREEIFHRGRYQPMILRFLEIVNKNERDLISGKLSNGWQSSSTTAIEAKNKSGV